MATQPENVTAHQFGGASIANSFLLMGAAAGQLDVIFWVLVMTNFVLMQAVWFIQLVRFRSWSRVDFGLVRWPLIAFAVLGNLALLLWGERLLAVSPT